MTVDVIQSLILGIVQGITEWLPISSSGHLALTQLLFNIKVPVFFDLILHIGTLAAVIGFYRTDILKIIKSVIYPRSLNTDETTYYRNLLMLIIIGTIPTAIIAFSLRSLFEFSFYDFFLLSIGFLISGVFIFITKFFNKGSRGIGKLDAFVIGIAQGFSVFSSISRSGITISLGMMRQIDHHQLVKFSFLLSIPAIIGGSVFDFVLMDDAQLSTINDIHISSYIVGFLSAAIVGYLTIKLLIDIINRGKLHYFAYYCLVLGVILLIYSML